MIAWFEQLIQCFSDLWPAGTFLNYPMNVQGLFAVIVVSLVCGSIGSLVVGNRMAFFSDALAHCAFAGVALGVLFGVVTGTAAESISNLITLIMVGFGILIGLGIAFVRDQTSQASDTVIGVFFAGAIGLGAVVLKVGTARRYFPPEDFLFGNLVTITMPDLVWLACLAIVSILALVLLYNRLVLTSVNTSLARSRGIMVRLHSYLFIVLLAIIVNVCLKVVGVLLVNALLIVPAAAAANVSRNMRQLFYGSIGICLVAGVLGQWLSWEIKIPNPPGPSIHAGESGTIVLLSVAMFFVSMVLRPVLSSRPRPQSAT